MAAIDVRPHKAVYTLVTKTDGTTRWVRIGSARENPDGSVDVELDALPVNGRMVVRPIS